jgi:hypothetical protein
MNVYISAPYSNGDIVTNIRRAIEAADKLARQGHTPYIPHLSLLWHLVSPKDYDFWLDYDMRFIMDWADCILRLDGESKGADKEVELARKLYLPVYYSL